MGLRAPHRGWDPADSRRRSVGRIIPVPGNVTVVTLPTDFKRGGWVVEHGIRERAAMAAGRRDRLHRHASIDRLGQREQNWHPSAVGATAADGPEVLPYSGHDSDRPIGDTSYNALQTRINRRSTTVFVQRELHAVAIRGTGRGVKQRPAATDTDSGSLRSESRGLGLRPHARVQRARYPGTAVRKGRRWLSNGGLLSAIVGGWQWNNVPEPAQRNAVHGHHLHDAARCGREHQSESRRPVEG